MSHTSKLIKPKEGALEPLMLLRSPAGLTTSRWSEWWGEAALWEWALNLQNLILSQGDVRIRASLVAPVLKNPPANARDTRDVGLTPGSGRSPGGGHNNPLQSSCLRNPMDRGAWRATVYAVTELVTTEAAAAMSELSWTVGYPAGGTENCLLRENLHPFGDQVFKIFFVVV